MTFTLELPAELGEQIERVAALRGVDAGAIIIEGTRAVVEAAPAPLPKGWRKAAIRAARGSLRGIVNSNDFLARRQFAEGSPLDVRGVNLSVSADEIVEFIREGRRPL